MSARSTLLPIILKLRTLLGDPAGPNQRWSNEDLQVFLDAPERRANVNFYTLSPVGNFTASVTVETLVYQAPCGDWEAGATLYDSKNVLLSPSEADYSQGRWIFTTDTPEPVTIVGRCFDMYGAAADALRARASVMSEDFDFKADNQAFNLSQKYKQLKAQAEEYEMRSRRWPGLQMAGRGGEISTGKMNATDVNPNSNPKRFSRFTTLTTYNVE